MEDHLIVHVIYRSYTKWVLHGELYESGHVNDTVDISNEAVVNDVK